MEPEILKIYICYVQNSDWDKTSDPSCACARPYIIRCDQTKVWASEAILRLSVQSHFAHFFGYEVNRALCRPADPRIVAQSSDPRCAQVNPWIFTICTLRKNIYLRTGCYCTSFSLGQLSTKNVHCGFRGISILVLFLVDFYHVKINFLGLFWTTFTSSWIAYVCTVWCKR